MKAMDTRRKWWRHLWTAPFSYLNLFTVLTFSFFFLSSSFLFSTTSREFLLVLQHIAHTLKNNHESAMIYICAKVKYVIQQKCIFLQVFGYLLSSVLLLCAHCFEFFYDGLPSRLDCWHRCNVRKSKILEGPCHWRKVMNGLVHDLNTLEIMIIRMIWIINLKNMTMIDMQALKMLLTYLTILTQILRQILQWKNPEISWSSDSS